MYELNGVKKGNEEGEFTHVRRNASTVIDYVITNMEGWESIRKIQIEDRVESGHQPVGIWLKSKIEKEKEGRVKQVIKKEVWTEEARKEYIAKAGKLVYEKVDLLEVWEELKVKVKKSREVKKIKIGKGKDKNWTKIWWDKDCKKKKKEVKKAYKDWKKGIIDRLKFVETRKEYIDWIWVS